MNFNKKYEKIKIINLQMKFGNIPYVYQDDYKGMEIIMST